MTRQNLIEKLLKYEAAIRLLDYRLTKIESRLDTNEVLIDEYDHIKSDISYIKTRIEKMEDDYKSDRKFLWLFPEWLISKITEGDDRTRIMFIIMIFIMFIFSLVVTMYLIAPGLIEIIK